MKTVLNRKARYNYEILEKWEAGIVLFGHEVKSVKSGHIDISSAYVSFKKDELFLISATISKYKYASIDDYDPQRQRKLLLKKSEIDTIRGKLKQKGLTLVPLKVYTRRNRVKILIGLGRGKRQFDKREDIKKRDAKRKMAQYFKKNARLD